MVFHSKQLQLHAVILDVGGLFSLQQQLSDLFFRIMVDVFLCRQHALKRQSGKSDFLEQCVMQERVERGLPFD